MLLCLPEDSGGKRQVELLRIKRLYAEVLMRIGYACLLAEKESLNYKTCTLKNASEERLRELIAHNLNTLSQMIDYNIKHHILLFRMTSDLIPFASHPVNTLKWWEEFRHVFESIGEKIRLSGMRVSMHPGQYTVINSTDEGVIKRSVEELLYHARVLDCMKLDSTHKLILHIGGIYGDKVSAIDRFKKSYRTLPKMIQTRLVIENDDRHYTISEVLEIGLNEQIPVVYDNLHHYVNSCSRIENLQNSLPDDVYWISMCQKTWKNQDGSQKVHYSQQAVDKRMGAHSETISLELFRRYVGDLLNANYENIDIMLEVKDKNRSAIKCGLCFLPVRDLSETNRRKILEKEWARYKYRVLETSQEVYKQVRRLFTSDLTEEERAVHFYTLIESLEGVSEHRGQAINACQHVWGYFKKHASIREKERFVHLIQLYASGEVSLLEIKSYLHKLARKYQQAYLLDTYYF